MSNKIIENESLSLPALGLLVYLLHKPDDWEVYPKHLASKLHKKKNSKAGYRYILELINELEEHGFCKKMKQFDGSVDYFIYDEPNAENLQQVEPNAEILHSPNVEKPHVEIPHHIINTNLITNTNSISSSAEPNNIDFFERFWEIYPRKSNKVAAKKKFTKLSAKKQQQIIQLTHAFTNDMETLGRSEEHILLPTTYLNQERYLDYEPGQITSKIWQPKEGADLAVEKLTTKIKILVEKYRELDEVGKAALNARSNKSFKTPGQNSYFDDSELEALKRAETTIAEFSALEFQDGEIKKMIRGLLC